MVCPNKPLVHIVVDHGVQLPGGVRADLDGYEGVEVRPAFVPEDGKRGDGPDVGPVVLLPSLPMEIESPEQPRFEIETV